MIPWYTQNDSMVRQGGTLVWSKGRKKKGFNYLYMNMTKKFGYIGLTADKEIRIDGRCQTTESETIQLYWSGDSAYEVG